MASALERACSGDGGTCNVLVSTGKPCPVHGGQNDRRRGHSAARGYDAEWRELADRFRQLLIRAGVAPVCGARLPGVPATSDSQCQAAGRLVDDAEHRRRHGMRLHTDHIRPHRGDRSLRLDPMNLQLLCKPEHDEKTRREAA